MASTTPTIRIRLFGPVQIEHDGVPVQKLGSQKSLVLLAYLIRHPHDHSRSKLASLLWIDQPAAKARSNLRWALNNLSNLLPDCFVASRQTLRYQSGPEAGDGVPWIDVQKFSDSVAALSTPQRLPTEPGDPRVTEWIDAAAQAVDLYRGEFLEGIELDDAPELELWLLQEREFWRREIITLLETLIAQERTAGHYAQAEAFAHRLLAIDAWHEETHRQLMWLLAATGQRSAALAQFETCRTILADELGVEPAAETMALYTQIRDGAVTSVQERLTTATDLQLPSPSISPASISPAISLRAPHHDWGEAPLVEEFYGREPESQELARWLVTEPVRLVLIIGMGGMGKTTFAAHQTRQWAEQFPHIIWRTLVNMPTAETILYTWVQSLAGRQPVPWPEHFDAQLHILLRYLREQRCLLILDNFESVLQEQGEAGHYRPGYETYGQLLHAIGNSDHQSTLLITTREEPYGLTRLMDAGGRVQRLELRGLDLNAGRSLLAERGLADSFAIEIALVMRASGSPLALKIIAETIRDLFAGDIGAFLDDETFIFDSVRDVLEQQFARLSTLEQAILLWLAIEREEVSLAELQANLAPPVARHTFLDAVRSLERRALLEKSPLGFTLQQVVAEHARSYLVAETCREIETVSPRLLKSHALCKALTKEYLRASQQRLILDPILELLENRLGRAGVEAQCRKLLTTLRAETTATTPDGAVASAQGNYAAGNILDLLVAFESDLRGWDFSHLPVWQAHLAQAHLPEVDFRHADFAKTSFADTFGLVHGVAFHPSGQELAATAEHEIRFWRDPDGQRSGVLRGHTDDVWSIAFNDEGTLLVSGSWDQTVRLWDLGAQKCIRTLTGHTKGVVGVTFSPDGQTIAGAGYDHTVRLWETESGELLQLLAGHTAWVWGVAFSPDGGLLASAGADRTIRLWQVRTGALLAVLEGHTDQVWSVAFHPEGRYLAAGSNDGLVLLWDIRTRTVTHIFRGHTNWVRSLAFTPDGTILASGSNDGTVRLWSITDGEAVQTLRGHRNAVNTVAISRSGRYLASGSNDQSVRLWDLATGQTVRLFHGYTNWVRAVAFHQNGHYLVSGGDDGHARLWEIATAAAGQATPPTAEPGTQLIRFTGHTQMVRSVALREDGRRLATAGADRTVRIWDCATGAALHLLRGHTNWVSSVAWGSLPSATGEIGPKGTRGRREGAVRSQADWVLSGGWDGLLCLWDGETGECLRTFRGHTQAVYAALIQPGGSLIASGSGDRTIRLWDGLTGDIVAVLTGHTDDVRTLAFSSDGRRLVSGGEDGSVRLWVLPDELTTQTVAQITTVYVFTEHPKGVRSVAVRADGELVAAGSDDGTISIWAWARGERLHHLLGHVGVVWSVAFAPDGQTLASGSSDGTVKVWSVTTGTCLHTITTPGPYAGMNIADARGLTSAQRETLNVLGAVDTAEAQATADRSVAAPGTRMQPAQLREKRAAAAFVAPPSARLLAATVPHNLPRERTPLIGRRAELQQIRELLLDGSRPLVTLIGEGGMGKTRLALAVAETLVAADDLPGPSRFADGVWHVPLAGITADTVGDERAERGAHQVDVATLETAVVTTIGAALRMHFAGAETPVVQLTNYLRDKQLLLLLDNFEHLLDAALCLSDLLADAPAVQILVTSRMPLNLQEEWRVPLQGLRVPDDAMLATETTAGDADVTFDALVQVESVALFLQAAQRMTPDFQLDATNQAAVVAICRYVHGLPLALELAATGLAHMDCRELANELIRQDARQTDTSDRGLDLLQTPLRNVPVRHRNIRNVFAYSWQLLTPAEQQCALQMALIRGGGDRMALMSITGQRPAILTVLVNKSVLYRDAAGRYTMHALLRQFCLEQLADTDGTLAVTTQDQQSRYFLEMVHAADAAIKGYEPAAHLVQLRSELDNIRQAWQWALHRGHWALIRRSHAALVRFFLLSGLLREGHSAMQEMAATLRTHADPTVYPNGDPMDAADQPDAMEQAIAHLFVDALVADAQCCNAQADYDTAIAALTEALAVGEEMRRRKKQGADLLIAAAELRWGEALWYKGEIEQARPRLARALTLLRGVPNPAPAVEEQTADVLCVLGLIAVRKGDYTAATNYYRDSHTRSIALADAYRVGRALYSLGTVYRNQGEYIEAQRYLEEGLAIAQQTGDRHSESRVLNTLGDISLYLGEYGAARDKYTLVLRLAQAIGDRRSQSIAQTNLGIVARDLGHYAKAEAYFHESLLTARAIGFQRGEGWNLCCLSLLCHQTARPEEALRHAQRALPLFAQLGDHLGQAYAQTNLGRAHADLAHWAEAQIAFETALSLRRTLAQPHLAIEVTAGLTAVLWEQGAHAAAKEAVEEIVTYLAEHNLNGVESPGELYRICYTLLDEAADPRAATILTQARHLLQERLAKLERETDRAQFRASQPLRWVNNCES